MARIATLLFLAAALVAGACGTGDKAPDLSSSEDLTEQDAAAERTYEIEVWADNWMAAYVNGELIGEDSVSITTERSFNAEAFTFEAAQPFTVAIEAKDFMETDSGIEYIGEPNQQIGDGGLIAQITDLDTGEVVSVSDHNWSALVIHRAPLNPDCVDEADPDSACDFESADAPDGWTTSDYDEASWAMATEWPAAAVQPKGGYDEISWDPAAAFIWGADLEIDNTVLLRATIDESIGAL